jgi:hypothetical protein
LFTLAEIAAACCSLAILAPLVAGSGATLAQALDFPGFKTSSRLERVGIGLLCGFGCVPLLLDFAGRLGPWPMTAALAALAIPGLAILARAPAAPAGAGEPPLAVVAGLSALWVVLGLFFISDWPTADGTFHSFVVLDHTKHSATNWAIAQTGTPPENPTFYAPGRKVAYYYFFYTLTGAAHALGAVVGLGARHASYAGAVLSGFALLALAWAAWRRSGADEAVGADKVARPMGLVAAALLLTTGLDVIPAAALNSLSEISISFMNIEFWNDQIGSWVSDALWVPHHVAGLCAAFVGFLALAADPAPASARRILLAALAFAAMAGLSVYVAIGAAGTALLWLAVLACRARWADAARLCAAGAGALVLAAPWLVTLTKVVGGDGPAPIGLKLRGAEWVERVAPDALDSLILRALTIPPFYFFEFGIFALGSYVFWRKAGRRGMATDLGMILVCATAASFLIGTFLRSTILNNDLGWRVMMFAQVATLVWTLAATRAGLLFDGQYKRVAWGFLWLGYVAVAVALGQMHLMPLQNSLEQATQSDEIAAWTWLNAHLPVGSVVQAQPDIVRNYAYGMYGQYRMAVSDHHNGRLFGATAAEVEDRIAVLAPLFADPALPLDETRRRAARFDIAALVVTALDPVFAAPGAWTAQLQPAYANRHVKIFFARPDAR